MSISDQFFSEKLLEGYVKTPPSLKEQAITKLAIQMCQHYRLYKHIIEDFDRQFVFGWSVFEWERRIVFQSSVLCSMLPLPYALKKLLNDRMWLINFRVFCWHRQNRIRFYKTHHATEEHLTLNDWTAEGRINGRKVIERLVQDERLPITQRYSLACLHFVEPYIFSLWNQIPPKRQVKFLNELNIPMRGQSNLVKLWSYHISGKGDELIERGNTFWQRCFEEAVREGQRTAVVYCWNMLLENTKQDIFINSAVCALEKYNALKYRFSIIKNRGSFEDWKCQIYRSKYWCAPPPHYSDILYFLVSHMSHEQIVQFYEYLFNMDEFDANYTGPVFEWLLESPYQIYFIPIITKLWDVLPEKYYEELLNTLTDKLYFMLSENIHNEEIFYDYGNLLVDLFKITPDHYYRYLYSMSNWRFAETICNIFYKMSFQHNDLLIFENILQHATVKEKQSLMHSNCGRYICSYYIRSGNREKLDMILSDCLPDKKIADFRKEFLLSGKGRETCFWFLTHKDGEQLNSLLNWAYLSTDEISDFKPKLIGSAVLGNELPINSMLEEDRNSFIDLGWYYAQDAITPLIAKFDTELVDKILEWCLPSEDARKQCKDEFCSDFKKNPRNALRYVLFSKSNLKCLTSKISQFLVWAFSSEEDRKLFKLKLFAKKFPKNVLGKSILHHQWQDVDFFVELFELSPLETKKLKKDVMWHIDTMYNILDLLYKSDSETVSYYLKWGLSDSKTVKAFKKRFIKFLCVDKKIERVQKLWDELIKVRVCDLVRETAAETRRRKREFEDKGKPHKLFKKQ